MAFEDGDVLPTLATLTCPSCGGLTLAFDPATFDPKWDCPLCAAGWYVDECARASTAVAKEYDDVP